MRHNITIYIQLSILAHHYCTILITKQEKEREKKMSKFIWVNHGSRWLWTEWVNYLHFVHHLASYSISSHYIQIQSYIFYPADSSCSAAICLELWNSSEVCRVVYSPHELLFSPSSSWSSQLNKPNPIHHNSIQSFRHVLLFFSTQSTGSSVPHLEKHARRKSTCCLTRTLPSTPALWENKTSSKNYCSAATSYLTSFGALAWPFYFFNHNFHCHGPDDTL